MTDTGAVCLAVGIVVAAGLIYVAAKNQTAVLNLAHQAAAAAKNQSEVALNFAQKFAANSDAPTRAVAGFALGEG